MKKSRLLEWEIFILAISCLMAACQGTPLAVKRQTKSPAVGSTSAMPSPPPTWINETPENDDVFVPYQGEKFNTFDWNLLKLMAGKYQGNLLMSPLSIKLGLVLLYEGAQDPTALELARVMHLPDGRWATRDKFALILKSLQAVSNQHKLDIGTRMYLQSGIDLKQSYAANVKSFYRVDVVPTNFENSQVAADNINNWVSNVTHKSVEKMIENHDRIKNAVLLIVNALYFQGSWHKNCFSPNDTKFRKFYTTPETPVDVPFMQANGNFYYSESLELDAKILRIPYAGHKFAMYFVLPNTRAGLDDLVSNINPSILSRHISLMRDLPVNVQIPKFKLTFTSYLESVLRDMGITDIFDNTAALIEIARAKRRSADLVVTDMVQKAGIEVNERGTTAYATTEIQIGNKMGEQQFIVDHPFLFFIEDEITGTILHMGRLSNPLEENGSTDTPIIPTFPSRMNDESDLLRGEKSLFRKLG